MHIKNNTYDVCSLEDEDVGSEHTEIITPRAPVKSIKSNIKKFNRPPPAIVTSLNNRFNMELENEALTSELNSTQVGSHTSGQYIHINQKNKNMICLPHKSGYTCTRKIISEEGEKVICGRVAFRHEMCSYHWGAWKRENPFSNGPW
jgi:hypothetical protein